MAAECQQEVVSETENNIEQNQVEMLFLLFIVTILLPLPGLA